MYKCENCNVTTRRRKKIFTGSDGLTYCKQCFDIIVRHCVKCGSPHRLNTLCDCVKEEPEAPQKTREQKRQDKEVKKAIRKQTYTHDIYPDGDLITPYNLRDDNVDCYDISSLARMFAECGIVCYPVQRIIGPSSVQYTFKLESLKKFKAVSGVIDAIGARLDTDILFNKKPKGADFAISILRKNRKTVELSRCINTKQYNAVRRPTGAVLGLDEFNECVAVDMTKMPHLLIAGTTGSGKTIALRSIIASMLFSGAPSEVELVIIDPKKIDMPIFKDLPHLATPIITDSFDALAKLNQICEMMDGRYTTLNANPNAEFTKLFVIIDELADLMDTTKKAVEKPIARIAQLGRAAGIHLIVATQVPNANVITRTIKGNMPARLALTVASHYEAKMMDTEGSNKLGGNGDAIFQPPNRTIPPVRIQCPFTSMEDVSKLVDWWSSPKSKGNVNSDGYIVDLAGNVRTDMGKAT